VACLSQWVEGDLLLTSDRVVFKARKGRMLWTFTLPHVHTLDMREIGGSAFSAGLTRAYMVQVRGPNGKQRQRIDTSATFMAN